MQEANSLKTAYNTFVVENPEATFGDFEVYAETALNLDNEDLVITNNEGVFKSSNGYYVTFTVENGSLTLGNPTKTLN